MAIVFPQKYEIVDGAGNVVVTEFSAYFDEGVLYEYPSGTQVVIPAGQKVQQAYCQAGPAVPDSAFIDVPGGDITTDNTVYATRSGDTQVDGAGRYIHGADTVDQATIDADLAVVDGQPAAGDVSRIDAGTATVVVDALDDGTGDVNTYHNMTQGTSPVAIRSGTAATFTNDSLSLDSDTAPLWRAERDRTVLSSGDPVTLAEASTLYSTGQWEWPEYDAGGFESPSTPGGFLTVGANGQIEQIPAPLRVRQSDVGGTINLTVPATISVINSWTFTAPFDGSAFNFSLRVQQSIQVDPPGARIGWRLRVLKNGAVLFNSPDYVTVDQGVGPTIDGAYHENNRVEPCLAGDEFTLQLLFFGNNGAPGNNASVSGQRVKIDFARPGVFS